MKTVLLGKSHRTGGNRRQNLYYSFSSESSEKFGEFATVHVGRNLDWALECYGAGIESLVHSEYGHAGLALPVHNGAFDWGCPAVSRQERGVDVPGAQTSGVERLRAQDLAVGCDDEGVVIRDLRCDLRYSGRLAQGQPVVTREQGYGGRCLLAPAAPARVGLGDHQSHLVVGGDETTQDGGGEVGCAGESYLHEEVGRLALGEEALAQLAHGGLAGLAVGAVQDQDPIEVIYLVLEDPREQAGSLDPERGARGVLT
jgi:hypothetical protein